jgi:hypothetical protein
MEVPGEQEAARAVEQLREFVALCASLDVRPGSRIANDLALARRAIAAYEEVQSWNLDMLEPTLRDDIERAT